MRHAPGTVCGFYPAASLWSTYDRADRLMLEMQPTFGPSKHLPSRLITFVVSAADHRYSVTTYLVIGPEHIGWACEWEP